jgi:hypothetical protein
MREWDGHSDPSDYLVSIGEEEYEEYRRIWYGDDIPRYEDLGIVTIDGFPDYGITQTGKVYSYMNLDERELKTWTNQHGHEYVQLFDRKGKGHKLLVHRLVAETFIPNPEGHPIVRHLDDDPSNNEVTNLAWGTAKDNHDDMFRNGHDIHKEVYCYETDTVYRSGAIAAYKLGVTRAGIVHACKGKSAHAGGYHVCYLEDKDYKLAHLDEWLRERTAEKPVHAGNLDTGETLYFKRVNEASSYLGIPACGISSTLHGRCKHTHRWYFWED